jgi:hypothetical protein
LNWSRQSLTDLYEQAKHETRPGPFTTHLERYVRYRLETAGRQISYDITQINHPWWKKEEETTGIYDTKRDVDFDMGNPLWKRGVMPFDFYRAHGYEYVITTSDDYELYLSPPASINFPSIHAFYSDLFVKGVLVKEFVPKPWSRPGPLVKIFKLNDRSALSNDCRQCPNRTSY